MNKISSAQIDLMRDSAKSMPAFASPTTVLSARVWHCKYKTLGPLAELTNLEELEIATVPDASLDFLLPLKKLRFLSILHLPKVTNIDQIAELTELENLSLRTLPSWDSSSKKSVLDSLQPLSNLKKLKHLELSGIIPADKSLAGVSALPLLQTLLVMPFAIEEKAAILARGVEERGAPMSSFHVKR